MRKFPFHAKTLTTVATQRHNSQLIQLNLQLAQLNRSSHFKHALHLFDKIPILHPHLKPDHYTLSTALTACANLPGTALKFGQKLHSFAIKSGLKSYAHVANSLLGLYSKAREIDSAKWVFGEIENPDVFSYTTLLNACTKMGHVGFALEVFDEMPEWDVAVWNAMITGCLESGHEEIGFGLFVDMCELGVRHDNYSFASILSAFDLERIDFGKQVHSLVIRTGYLAVTSVVNALITMYFKCKAVADACLVFEEVESSRHDEITFNVMVDGLASIGRVEEALIMFRELLMTGLRPNDLSFVSFMSSCSDARIGHQVHVQAIKMGFEACTSVSNASIAMYSSCGDLHAAYIVFERLEEKDLVSWNTLISSYSQVDFGRLSMLTYMEMQKVGVEPDEFTFGSLLASSELIETIEMIHALVYRNGIISNIQVSNSLICAYSKHGIMKQAYQIFSHMCSRNVISWNSIISGFHLNGLPMQGLEQFSELLTSGLRPNEYTLSISLSICASISALRCGKQIHGYILRFGFSSIGSLANTVITMYAKCGFLELSLRVFNSMTERDLVSWNALISAYAQHGQGKEAVRCFEAMQYSSVVKPDQATFNAILSACSHAGLVNDGTQIFNTMLDKYGIVPGIDHFSCIVDLLGRSGCFNEVERIINSHHFKPHPSIWWPLISACAAHGNLKLGRLVAGYLLETEKDNPSVYVLLSNIYAAAGQWEEAAKVRHSMDNNVVMKQAGNSWISL